MSAVDKRKLQRMIDRSAKAHTEAYRATQALCDWCRENYGAEPGDVDADQIIDAVLGGCGESNGMRAADFDALMRELTA